MSSVESRKTFFRQSTWMMAATVVSGAMMFLVHPLANKLPDGQYAAVGTMLQFLYWLGIPAVGLQMVFAQLAASATTPEQEKELHGAVRGVVRATLVIWLVAAVAVFFLADKLVAGWGLTSQWPLWVTTITGLLLLWLPIAMGLLQGRQNFLWFGWTTMINAGGRVAFSYLIVFFLSASALGITVAIFLGLVSSFSVAAWQSRSAWLGPMHRFRWGSWLRRVCFLTMGFGSYVAMFSSDVMLIRPHFEGEAMDAYTAGGTLARAIVQFTAPLAAVMFPKIVHGLARSEKTDTFKLTVIGVVVLGCCAAIGLTVVSPYVFKYVFPSYQQMVPYMAAFSWAMVPLAVANVLINNLMAHSRFLAAPFLLAVALAYVATLAVKHDSFNQVIAIIGGYNCLMLIVAGLFTWWNRASR